MSLRRPRLIPRLDIKGQNLIKGIQMEGLRIVGDPAEYAKRYADQEADEIIYLDTVASLYGRNQLAELLLRTTADVFIPITVGGGITSVGEVQRLLNSGADSIALNTGAIRNPSLIGDIARRYGSQAVVVSIEAKRKKAGWEAYMENGREPSGKDALEWAIQAAADGAGEILITSVDREGTRQGFDIELVGELTSRLDIPVVAAGGMGSLEHLKELMRQANPDGVAIAHMLHYGKTTICEMRAALCIPA